MRLIGWDGVDRAVVTLLEVLAAFGDTGPGADKLTQERARLVVLLNDVEPCEPPCSNDTWRLVLGYAREWTETAVVDRGRERLTSAVVRRVISEYAQRHDIAQDVLLQLGNTEYTITPRRHVIGPRFHAGSSTAA